VSAFVECKIEKFFEGSENGQIVAVSIYSVARLNRYHRKTEVTVWSSLYSKNAGWNITMSKALKKGDRVKM
jgi:hypothetical protein